MISAKIGEPSPRVSFFQPEKNEESLRVQLDLWQEEREVAHVREQSIKQRVAKRYIAQVVPRSFKKGRLVFKRLLKDATTNKLSPNWESLFRV